MTDPRITVRPVEPRDAPLLQLWRSEASVRRHQPLAPFTTGELRAEISSRRHNDLWTERGGRFDWIVEVDGRPAGWITLVVHSWDHGLAEWGYALSTAYQGRGIMRRALDRVLPDLFERTSLYRIEARCSVDNIASQKVLEHLGFVREGRLRGYFFLDGKRVDNYLYALTREDREESGPPG
ncbi:MAG: GNAT family protein [Thermoanaerobaculia bacterium]|nr:GNAT family protein [Thermoanaerobaculia bacterium]